MEQEQDQILVEIRYELWQELQKVLEEDMKTTADIDVVTSYICNEAIERYVLRTKKRLARKN